MRSSSAVAFLAVALLTGACTIERADVRTPSGEPPEADSTSVAKVLDAVGAGFESGDLESLDTLYHPDALFYDWGSVAQGWKLYRDEHLATQLSQFDDREYLIESRTIRIAGGTAWATFRYTMEAGPRIDRYLASGVGTVVLQKLRSRWVIVHSHTSAGF